MSGIRLSWPVNSRVPDPLWSMTPRDKPLPGALLYRWAEALEAWDAPPEVRAALHHLEDPKTLVFVTGQQSGIAGGPLFSAYKAATALALARRATVETGRPAVAIFWAQGDDTDWDEVGNLTLPGPDLALQRHRYPAPFAPRHWIGDAPTPVAPEGWLGEFPSHRGKDLGEAFILDLLTRFGGEGLLPLDSRWAELRAAGTPLWRRYRAQHQSIAQAVYQRGVDLRATGRTAPLDQDAASQGLFLVHQGERLSVEDGAWESEVDRCLSEATTDTLAPSVLLRAPLQDWLFGTAAQIVGATEAAYLEQLQPLYDRLELNAPSRPPRMRITLVPEGMIPPDELYAACHDPEGWIAGRAAQSVPESARAALAHLRESLHTDLQQVAESMGDQGGDLPQVVEAGRRKMEGQIGRIDETLDRRVRQNLYRTVPGFRHLTEFLRPRRADQERGLSAVALDRLFSPGGTDVLRSVADRHVDRLHDGVAHHFVLEFPHG